jgi:hypothetical protein
MPRFPHDARGLGGRSPESSERLSAQTCSVCYLGIVILSADDDTWCQLCGLPSATTITYVLEPAGAAPSGVCRLTYCETCEGA